MYEMFMGPFDQAVSWNTDSMIGPRRFLEKVWRIGHRKFITASDEKLKKVLHKTIKKVGEDIESMNFNTAISALMILATEMDKAQWVSIEDYKKFLQILSPFAPHIAEELWSMLGEKKSINLSNWPKWDENLIKDDEVKIVVQVNGKVRTEILISAEDTEEKIKGQALTSEAVAKYTAGENIKKVIYVPGRLINIVV